MGVKLLERLAEDVTEMAIVESMPRQDGRNMTMVLAPTKRKHHTKSDQRRRRDQKRGETMNRQQLKDARKARKAKEAQEAEAASNNEK